VPVIDLSEIQELLIIQSAGDICDEEIKIIEAVSSLHHIDVSRVNLDAGENISSIPAGKCFDLIYLCGQGSVDGMGGSFCKSWDEIAVEICNTTCTKNGATIFCACCRGGLKTVAKAFFNECPSVEFVIGPRSNIYPESLILAFHVVMYNIFFRKSEPPEAAAMACQSTGQEFIVHDQQQWKDALPFWHTNATA